jgi:hypothetical protein
MVYVAMPSGLICTVHARVVALAYSTCVIFSIPSPHTSAIEYTVVQSIFIAYTAMIQRRWTKRDAIAVYTGTPITTANSTHVVYRRPPPYCSRCCNIVT